MSQLYQEILLPDPANGQPGQLFSFRCCAHTLVIRCPQQPDFRLDVPIGSHADVSCTAGHKWVSGGVIPDFQQPGA